MTTHLPFSSVFAVYFFLLKVTTTSSPGSAVPHILMGYTAGKDCVPANAPYNAEKDITFFEGLAETYITVKPGMFAIFFPQDGHAPGISPDGVKKVIVKVKA